MRLPYWGFLAAIINHLIHMNILFLREINKVFAGDMILYIENPKDSTKKTTRTDKWIQ